MITGNFNISSIPNDYSVFPAQRIAKNKSMSVSACPWMRARAKGVEVSKSKREHMQLRARETEQNREQLRARETEQNREQLRARETESKREHMKLRANETEWKQAKWSRQNQSRLSKQLCWKDSISKSMRHKYNKNRALTLFSFFTSLPLVFENYHWAFRNT